MIRGVDHAEVQAFVATWVDGWNAHDLDRIMGHYADDVVFTSPVAAQLLDDCDGVIAGRAALRAYWDEGLRRIPDLCFEMLGTYVGVSTIVMHYRNQKGGQVCEVLTFRDGLVIEGHGTYAGDNANPAGAVSS